MTVNPCSVVHMTFDDSTYMLTPAESLGSKKKMEIVATVDYGNAPEILVTGICAIERISSGQVRIDYYRRIKGENRVVLSCIWDLEDWIHAHEFVTKGRPAIIKAVLAEYPVAIELKSQSH
jgi:hypothetical protein